MAVLPANDPEILVYVMLDDPNNAHTDYSVSYTHLDVYKRQSCTSSFQLRRSEYIRARDRGESSMASRRISLRTVSYTHLIYGKQTTVRIIVVTAPVKGQESQNHGKA